MKESLVSLFLWQQVTMTGTEVYRDPAFVLHFIFMHV